MRQLGNLAVVVAQHKNARMEIQEGKVLVTVLIDSGTNVAGILSKWDDDEQIERLVYNLNHGCYRA